MTDATRTLDVVLPVDSERIASNVASALSVEVSDVPPRTRVRVEARGADVRIRIESEDTRGLRAAANSFLRWADTAIGVARTLRD